MGAPMDRQIEIVSLIWEAITIEVTYEAEWLRSAGAYQTAHLQVRSIDPDRAPLPFTETGYRSRFLPRQEVEELGGAEAYVRAWLEEAATSPEWRAERAAGQQLTLF
jgi:hypothetical protein